MPLAETQEQITERFDDGGSLAEVEEELIDSAPFTEEQRAALWLYASATIPRDLAEATAEVAQQSRSRLGGFNTALLAAGKRAFAKARPKASATNGTRP
jgi:hypothetical protein